MSGIKIKKIKPRKIREINKTRFKEVKVNGNDKEVKEEEKEESKLEHEIEQGTSDFGESRTAPVLSSQNASQGANLERNAGTAQTAAQNENTNANLNPLYDARRQGAERGYGQESYTKIVDYTTEARESERPTLVENQRARDMREIFSRRQQQSAWTEDARIRETWRAQEEIREVREYENIEKKSIEDSQKLNAERRRKLSA